MKKVIPLAAITAVLSLTLLRLAAQEKKEQASSSRAVSVTLEAENTAVQLGAPIRISLKVKSHAKEEMTLDKSATAFDCFQVTDPDGQAAPYVGFLGQIMSQPIRVAASATVTIADRLDLADKYIFQKAGRYSLRFRGEQNGIPGSNTITIEVAPGQLTELDQIVTRLLPVRPKGWYVTKSPRDQPEVAPFGRSRVAGYEAHICRNYMAGEALYLWLTKAEAPLDPAQKPRIKSDYLGRTQGLCVYAAVDSKTPALWPKAIDNISRVLQIAKE